MVALVVEGTAATVAGHTHSEGTVSVGRAVRVAVVAIADWMDSWYSAVVVVAVDRADSSDSMAVAGERVAVAVAIGQDLVVADTT